MKLPRLQLHLSTCIVLMFVAGGLVWANVNETDWYAFDQAILVRVEYGWPTTAYMVWKSYYIGKRIWNWTHLTINIATALAILAAVAFVCEWIIRRREPRAKS